MNKRLIFLSASIAVIMISLLVSGVIAKYPGPDTDTDTDGGTFDSVSSTAEGRYLAPTYSLYTNTWHSSSRAQVWPCLFVNYLVIRWWANNYDSGEYSYTYGDSASGGASATYSSWVSTMSHSHFTNAVLGGEWTRTATSIVYASA